MSAGPMTTMLAIARVAYGSALTLAPRSAARRWLGEHVDDAGAEVALRGLGARDVALGAGALVALRARQQRATAVWVAAQAVADAADLGATLFARRRLPRDGVRAAAAIAGGAVLLDAAEAIALARSARRRAP